MLQFNCFISDLAGIGETLGKRLTEKGFDKVRTSDNNDVSRTILMFCILQAYTVLGQYLILKKDADLFKEWLKDTTNANSKQAADCYQCLSDWCEEFL
jgi:barrier-to-autointegration factor